MNSRFGDIFFFLTDLAWKSRVTIPILVTTVFLIMDIRLQIEINIQTGQMAAAELEEYEDDDDDIDAEYSSDENDEDENGNLYIENTEENVTERSSNPWTRSLGIS